MKTSPRFAVLAVLTLACAATFTPAARADEIAITEAARIHFSAGVRLLQDPAGPRYEEAYQEFKVAYQSSPSARILGNVGLCAMKLERDEEAIQAYEKYLGSDAKIDPAERTQIERDLGTLKASVAHITLTVDAPDVRIVDVRTPVQGSAVTNVHGPFAASPIIHIGIHPGHHTITVKGDGSAPATWEIDAAPGASLTHTFTLQSVVVAAPTEPVAPDPLAPAATPSATPDVVTRPTPSAVYALGGVSAVLAGIGIVTGALAVSKHSQYEQMNDGSPAHYQNAASLRNAGQKLNVATDLLFGAALVGAAATLGIYFTRQTVSQPATTGLTDVHLRVGTSGGGLVNAAIAGAF